MCMNNVNDMFDILTVKDDVLIRRIKKISYKQSYMKPENVHFFLWAVVKKTIISDNLRNAHKHSHQKLDRIIQSATNVLRFFFIS